MPLKNCLNRKLSGKAFVFRGYDSKEDSGNIRVQQKNDPEQAGKGIGKNKKDDVGNVSMKRDNVHAGNGAEPLSGGPWNTGTRSVRICRESLLT